VKTCECVDCKCQPCLCSLKEHKSVEQLTQELKSLTVEPKLEQSDDQIKEESVTPAPQENVLVNTNTVVANEDNEKVAVVQTEEIVEQQEPKTETNEKKCLCNPCHCVDCKCGQHEDSQQSPTNESEVVQTIPAEVSNQESTPESQPQEGQQREAENQVNTETEQQQSKTQPEEERQESEQQETDKTESNEETNRAEQIVEILQEFNQELQTLQQ